MRRSLLLCLLVLLGMSAQAQMHTFTVLSTTLNTYDPVYNSNTNNKYQALYFPANFTPAMPQSGYIQKIYFRAYTASLSTTFTNFTVKVQTTTATTLNGTFVTTPFTQTVTIPTLTIAPVTPGTWYGVDLPAPGLLVTNTQNLLVEVSHDNVTNGFRCWNNGATTIRSTYGPKANATGSADANFLPSMGFDIVEPCRPVQNLSITEITTTHAKFNWGTWSNAIDYELVINGDRTPPTGVYYYAFPNGPVELDTFTPGTCYYVHMRTKCNAAALNDSSTWITDSFCTQPDCDAPVVTVTNEMSTTAIASWDPVPNVLNYEYAISMLPDPPVKGTITTYTKLTMQGLTPNKTHYVHVRAHCTPVPDSKWRSTPFHTANTTDVSDVQADGFALSVYPNPVKDLLMVNITGQLGANAHVMITDLTGKVLLNNAVQADRLSVDMSNLPAGLYLVKYKDDVRTETLKAIKQ